MIKKKARHFYSSHSHGNADRNFDRKLIGNHSMTLLFIQTHIMREDIYYLGTAMAVCGKS